MPDDPTGNRLISSPNLFSVIERDATTTGLSTVLITPIDCIDDLGTSTITVSEAREMVINRTTPDQVRDAMWTAILRGTRSQPKTWQRIALWTMLPYLRGITCRLHRAWGTDLQDLRSEVIVGFLEAARQADPEEQHLGRRLWWNTYRIARQMCKQAACVRAIPNIEVVSASVGPADPAPMPPADPSPATADRHDPQLIESERLGSLAARLGLRATIAGNPANARPRRPQKGRPRRPSPMSARGNGSGEAA